MYFKVSLRHNPAKEKMDGCYRLIESYRDEVINICPRYHLFGHIHEAYGIYQQKVIIFMNGSVFNYSDMVENSPIELKLTGN
jgi:Icc-related predicted phosphoesterase